MAVDAFLKFEGFEGQTHKLGNLGDSFTDLGGAFIKLADDVSSTDVNFFKADLAAHIKHDVFTIGQEFLKLTGPLDTFDDAVVKFTLKVAPSESETLAADFVKFENVLKLTGLDFLGAASDMNERPTENLSLTFNKIAVDYQNQSDDLLKIGEDFANVVDISGISESKVGETFLKITLETVLVSSADLALKTDFQKISDDLKAASDSGLKTFDQVVLKYADDFGALANDLKIADGAFATLGADFVKLADAIQHPGPTITPTIT